MLKLGIISFVVLFLILLLMSLLIPSTVRVSRAINIQAAKKEIYPLLAETRNWPLWNEVANEAIKVTVVSAGESGVVTAWTHGDKRLTSSFTLEESARVTVVQWYFDFRLKWYPWEKIHSIIFDKQFGPLMERSLNNLKKLVENSP